VAMDPVLFSGHGLHLIVRSLLPHNVRYMSQIGKGAPTADVPNA